MSVAGLCECGCGLPAPIAKRNGRDLGHVKGESVRFIPGHQRQGKRDWRWHEEDRGHETPCWIWDSYVEPNGYGKATRNGGGDMDWAYRVIYELLVGPIPEGFQLDHLCRPLLCES